MQIRKLGPKDADAFRRLRLDGLRAFPHAFVESTAEFEALSASEVVARIVDPRGLNLVLGAFDEGELVGIVGIEQDAPEKMRHKGMIWGMYVAPSLQGRGVGKQLLEAAIAHARTMPGLVQLRLIVSAGSAGARRLYESLGFVEYGFEPRELRTNGAYYDSVHMWLKLESVGENRR